MEAVGRLAGGVAHDFNNMLTVIMGYCDYSLAKLEHESEPVQMGIKMIMEAAQKASALTRQLLAFSRKQVIQPKSLILNEIIIDIKKMLNRLIREDIQLMTRLVAVTK